MKEITIGDLITAGVAYQDRQKNMPTESHKRNLQALIDNVLQPLINQFPTAEITCGYRSSYIAYNYSDMLVIDHKQGRATAIWWCGETLDIEQSVYEMYKWIVENLQFNTLDIYDTFIDISYNEKYNYKIVNNMSVVHNKHIDSGVIID